MSAKIEGRSERGAMMSHGDEGSARKPPTGHPPRRTRAVPAEKMRPARRAPSPSGAPPLPGKKAAPCRQTAGSGPGRRRGRPRAAEVMFTWDEQRANKGRRFRTSESRPDPPHQCINPSSPAPPPLPNQINTQTTFLLPTSLSTKATPPPFFPILKDRPFLPRPTTSTTETFSLRAHPLPDP